MGEIEFRGELHYIPSGAALVLKVDRSLTMEQMERIKEYCLRALGPDHRVLVVGPEIEVLALDRLPVVSMGARHGEGLGVEPQGVDPMEAARALVKNHGGGSGG